jgi:hypothetical protein
MADDNSTPHAVSSTWTTTTTTTSVTSAAAGPASSTTGDGTHTTTVVHPTVTTTSHIGHPLAAPGPNIDQFGGRPSIRIQRQDNDSHSEVRETRRRSSSDPQRPPTVDNIEIRPQATVVPLQPVPEDGPSLAPPSSAAQRPGWGRQLSSISVRARNPTTDASGGATEYDSHVVDMLDVIGKLAHFCGLRIANAAACRS